MATAKVTAKATAMKTVGTPTANGWKTCTRGHKYRGSGPCPTCWPGGTDRTKKKPR